MLEDAPRFSQEDIERFIELGKTLKRIHARLRVEGYTVKDGKIEPPEPRIP